MEGVSSYAYGKQEMCIEFWWKVLLKTQALIDTYGS